MRMRPITTLAAAVLLALLPLAATGAPMPPAGEYTYRIHHPEYGEIGTYTNRITQNGDTVNVDTTVRIAVKLAFVTVYRLEADRSEQWRDGRLVAFSSVTEKNGKISRVAGRAEGDRFVIEGPRGRTAAPAGVWPDNPWSPAIAQADAIMGTVSGKLYEPRITNSRQETVPVQGQPIPTQHYEIVTGEPNDLWYDASGRLVKFTTVEDGDVITLTLR